LAGPKPGGIKIDPNNVILKGSTGLRARAAIARGEDLAEQGRFYDAGGNISARSPFSPAGRWQIFRMGEAFFYQKNYQASANAFAKLCRPFRNRRKNGPNAGATSIWERFLTFSGSASAASTNTAKPNKPTTIPEAANPNPSAGSKSPTPKGGTSVAASRRHDSPENPPPIFPPRLRRKTRTQKARPSPAIDAGLWIICVAK